MRRAALRASALSVAPLSALALSVGLFLAPSTWAQGQAAPKVKLVDSVADGIKDLLAERKPRVVAFGEFHQTTATTGVESSLKRFTEQILPVLSPAASDLVLETWITDGKCGEQEKSTVADVAKTTERPANTESELVTLIKRAKAAGAEPHILKLTCKDYDAVHPPGGEVDYLKMLQLTSRKLEGQIDESLLRKGADPKRTVAVYGGALHNDLTPIPELASCAFGSSVKTKVAGRYLEVDLYVPEYIEGNARVTGEPWFAAYKKAWKPGKAAIIERADGSAIVVYPRTAPELAAAGAPGAAPATAPAGTAATPVAPAAASSKATKDSEKSRRK